MTHCLMAKFTAGYFAKSDACSVSFFTKIVATGSE